MSKRVVIVHAWDEGPVSCWYQWLKQKLEAEGFEVVVPEMPDASAPKIEPWVSTLRKILPDPDSETILVGHSVGCQTILRYLATLQDDQTVGKTVIVAPWTHLINLGDESAEIARPWLETPIDWGAAKHHCPKFAAFFSDNDEWVPMSEADVFRNELGAETQIINQVGHFDKNAQFPELIKEVTA